MNGSTSGAGALRVLCLEDSPVDAELVREALAGAVLQLEWDMASDRPGFEELLAGGPYDVILADYSLPGFDAHGALQLARVAYPTTPFICVSGKIGEETTVELLKEGVDDCVLKDHLARLPFAVQRAIDERARETELRQSESSEQRLRELNGELEASLREINVLKERLQEQAIRDPLTTLYNRRFLDDSLVREIARAQRSATPVSFLMLDIDHFKQVNDTYSHAAGDATLRAVSQVLLAGARAGDTVTRYGGEEFVVVMPGSRRADAFGRAEQIRTRVGEMIVHFDTTTFSVHVSIGVAEFPSDGATAAEAIAAADRAMYRGKESGRNKTVAACSGLREERLGGPSDFHG